MAWQHGRSAQIPCLIVCVAAVLVMAGPARTRPGRTTHAPVRGSVAVPQTDAALREKKSALDSIRAELDKGRRKVADLERQEGTETSRLDLLDTNIRNAQRYITGMSGRMDGLAGEIAVLDHSLVLLQEQLRRRQTRMAGRLRAMYMTGGEDLVLVVLTSGSLTQAFDRVRYFQSLHRYDTLLAHAIDSTRRETAEHKTALVGKRNALDGLRRDKEQEQRSLEGERGMRQKLIKDIQAQRAAYLAMIRDLEAAQKELNDVIKKLAARKKPASAAASEKALAGVQEKRRGSYPWPADGAVVRGFGKVVHPVYKTVTMNNGIDISASKGSPVVSIAAGKAVYVGRMRGMGTFLVVDHSAGLLSIYARLDQVLVNTDQMVLQGTRVATVGDGGAGGEPALHFEIRRNGEAVDPQEWLKEKRQ